MGFLDRTMKIMRLILLVDVYDVRVLGWLCVEANWCSEKEVCLLQRP